MRAPRRVNWEGPVQSKPEEVLRLISHCADQTRMWGQALASILDRGDVLCLVGELGAGKTCFVQGVGRGLGVSQVIVSPTFIRIREYAERPSRLPLYHIDLYRVEPSEGLALAELGDYLYGDGVCAIEWAERIRSLLPDSRLWVHFEHAEEPRIRYLSWWAEGERSNRILSQFHEMVLER